MDKVRIQIELYIFNLHSGACWTHRWEFEIAGKWKTQLRTHGRLNRKVDNLMLSCWRACGIHEHDAVGLEVGVDDTQAIGLGRTIPPAAE